MVNSADTEPQPGDEPTPRSAGGSGNSIRGTASGSATPAAGFNGLSSRLVSVLHSELGLPLAALLNDRDSKLNHPKLHLPKAPEEQPAENGETVVPATSVFSEAWEHYVSEGYGGETRLTPKMRELSKKWAKPNKLEVGREVTVEANDRISRCDMIIFHTNPDETKSVVMLLEVGIGQVENDPNVKGVAPNRQTGRVNCWTKLSQAITYLDDLQTNKKRIVFDKPALLAVLSLDGDGGARLVVFLCSPGGKAKVDFDMALLWRIDTSQLGEKQKVNETSDAFGRLLLASLACHKWGEGGLHTSNASYAYSPLGPNCCRVDNMLLRCYDTRFRLTERKPTMYDEHLYPEITYPTELFPENGEKSIILEVPDMKYIDRAKIATNAKPGDDPNTLTTNDVTDFNPNNMVEATAASEYHRLWNFIGKLQVIIVPFQEGNHVVRYPIQFLSIVNHLKWLHDQNYVHGDIRLFNMVFTHCEHKFFKELSNRTLSEKFLTKADALELYHGIEDKSSKELLKGHQKKQKREIDHDIEDKSSKEFLKGRQKKQKLDVDAELVQSDEDAELNQDAEPTAVLTQCPLGCLIDFDFSGWIGGDVSTHPRYPKGYNNNPGDGQRRGVAPDPIKVADDWFALATVMFHVHRFVPPKTTTDRTQINQLFADKEELMGLLTDPAPDFVPPDETIWQLRKFLIDAQKLGFTFEPLIQNLLGQNKATGSPPKERLH